ncbi:MAG: DUF4834 family protein [Bacteroidales bacterium]
MKFLLIILLFFILLVMLLGFTVIRTVYKFLTGGGKKNQGFDQQRPENREQWNNTNKKEKLFSKDEGEYIDFEEIDIDEKKKK